MTTNYMSNYSYGPDCFKEIPEVLDKYKVHKVVFIGGEKALKSSQEGGNRICTKPNLISTALVVVRIPLPGEFLIVI